MGDSIQGEDTASMHSDGDDGGVIDARSELEVDSLSTLSSVTSANFSIHTLICSSSRDDKYRILTTEPSSDPSTYPRTRPYKTSSFRQFQPSWTKQQPWLHYSLFADGAFCRACALLVARVLVSLSHHPSSAGRRWLQRQIHIPARSIIAEQ